MCSKQSRRSLMRDPIVFSGCCEKLPAMPFVSLQSKSKTLYGCWLLVIFSDRLETDCFVAHNVVCSRKSQ